MSGVEERIMELIRQLREEIRMNDQRIKQLSGGTGGGVDLTALMLKAIYDANGNGVVDNSEKLAGLTLEEILAQCGGGSGDMLKSVYDTNNDGVVDNADKVDGQHATDFASASHQHDENDLNLSDVTTGNVDTSRHGFCPKLPGDDNLYLDGKGNFSQPELHGGGVLDTDIRYEEQNDILFYHEPSGKWMNLSRFKGVIPESYTPIIDFYANVSEGVCASEDAVFGSNLDTFYKFSKSGTQLGVGSRQTVNGCDRPEDMAYYNGIIYCVQNNYPNTPRKAVVVKYRASDLAYIGYIPLYNDHYATTIARDDNGHWWLTSGANPVYLYHYDENWNFIDSRVLIDSLGTYGYQGIFWRRGHLYANTHYGNDDQYLDVWSYDEDTDTFSRIARASHYIWNNQNGQGVKPDPTDPDVLWWVVSQNAKLGSARVEWNTSSVPFSLFNISFANGKAQMTSEPTEDSDIATKKYVDDNSGVASFDDLTDTPESKSGAAGKFVAVKSDESGLEYVDAPSGGGVDTFLELTDTPSSYVGQGGKVARVKSTEDGLEFADPATPAAHHTTHEAGGSDAIKLDDLDVPDDNTDLDVNTSRHGLCPKAPNDTTKFLRGDATWAVPPSGGASAVDFSYYRKTSDSSYNAWYAVPQFITNKGATTWQIGSANRIYAQPLIIAKSIKIIAVAINVTTAASGKYVTIGIYNDNGNINPAGASLVAVCGETSVGTTGIKVIDCDITLDPGLYWMCFYSDGTPTIRAAAYTQVIHQLGFTSADGACNSYIYASATYSGGNMPATFPESITVNTGQNLPMVFMLFGQAS